MIHSNNFVSRSRHVRPIYTFGYSVIRAYCRQYSTESGDKSSVSSPPSCVPQFRASAKDPFPLPCAPSRNLKCSFAEPLSWKTSFGAARSRWEVQEKMPPNSISRASPTSTEFAHTMRIFSPLDFQISRRCFLESDRLLADAKFVMPLLLPISRVLLNKARAASHIAKPRATERAVDQHDTGGRKGMGRIGRSILLEDDAHTPVVPKLPSIDEVMRDCGVNLFSWHVASKFINRYTGPSTDTKIMLGRESERSESEKRDRCRGDEGSGQGLDSMDGGLLRHFDPKDCYRPNQIKLLLRIFKWLEEGVRTGILEVQTLLHEFEDLENISTFRALSYPGSFKPRESLCRIREPFLYFIGYLIDRLASYDNFHVPARPGVEANSAAQNAYAPLPHEAKEASRLFVMQCRCVLSNLYVRIDPQYYSVNKYECSLLGTMEMRVVGGVLQGTEHEYDALSDKFVTDLPSSLPVELKPRGDTLKSPVHVVASEELYTPAGTSLCSHTRFIPNFLRRFSFSDLSPDYEYLRLSRFLLPETRKTLKKVEFEVGNSGAITNKILDVAMTEPSLVELCRPPFAELEAALVKYPLIREWLLIGGNSTMKENNKGIPRHLLNDKLVADVLNVITLSSSATKDDTTSHLILAKSFVGLMVIPPHLVRGVYFEGTPFLDQCEAEIKSLLCVGGDSEGRAESSSKENAGGALDKQADGAPPPRLPLMAGLQFKLHPFYKPRPLPMPLEEAIRVANREEKRLLNLKHHQRNVREARANEDLKRAIKRNMFPNNVYNNPDVLAQLIYDLMPDHSIDIRQLRVFLPPEAQFGATFERRMITQNPHLFVDVTPVNWQRLQFQRADVARCGTDYGVLPDDELALLFVSAIKGRLARNDLPDSNFKDPLFSTQKIFAVTGRRFSAAISKRFGSHEDFIKKFPRYFVFGRTMGNDCLFKMARAEGSDSDFLDFHPANSSKWLNK